MRTAATIALVCATALSCAGGALHAAAPGGCTSIQDVAPIYGGIQFGAAIEGIFTNYSGNGNGCADCHTTNGGTTTPTGALDLDPQDSPSPYLDLIDVDSPWYPGYVYVVPKHPELSLLFMKVDCDNPGAGARMPLDNYAGGLTAQQIALIYDWIAEGAPSGTTDGIFRNGFDIRGFAQ